MVWTNTTSRIYWKAANVNGKIIPNKCSLKANNVQRLCKCVKPTPAHCSTKGYLKHKSECKDCECKPGYNKLWVPFSITGTISVEIKTQKWKLISANDPSKSAGDTKDGLTIYNEGRASYILPWKTGKIEAGTTKIAANTEKWFEVYWNISSKRWEVSINTKGDSKTAGAKNVVLFTNTDLTTRDNQHLPPKNGWEETKINNKDTTMNFVYGKPEPTCNLGLFEMRCVPTVCLRPEMKAYNVQFKNSIPNTFNINTIPLLSRKFNKTFNNKNICNPGYTFSNIKPENRITACTKSFEPIKINENICKQVKCKKLDANIYVSNDSNNQCAKSDTNHETKCQKVSCKDKVLNYQWDTTKKACMLGKTQVKTINNNLATPINCKKTTIRKYWADNSGKYKDFTCKGVSENKSNLTSGGPDPGIELGTDANSCSEKTCSRKGNIGGHIIKDTIPFTPSGIIKKIQGVPDSWALNTVPVKTTIKNCKEGTRVWYDNKCFEASAKIEKNDCKGKNVIWNSKMKGHDIQINFPQGNCKGPGKTWKGKCFAKSYCYTKIDNYLQTPSKKNCKGDTMFWDETKKECFPSVSYRFSPSISTEINEKRPIKASIGQKFSPWFSQKEKGKEYNCDLSSKDDKLTCKGRTMLTEENAPECYNTLTNGEDYRGKQNVVYHKDGKPPTPCLNWSTHPDENYKSIAGNFCRNPGGLKNNNIKEPWCVTASDEKTVTTASCNINKCTYKPVQKKGIVEMKYNAGPDTNWKPVCLKQIKKKNEFSQAICKNIGYSGAKELPKKNSGKRWKGITDADRYYQLKELFMINDTSKEFWPGYTQNIYIPENAKWGIRIRLSPTATGGGATPEKIGARPEDGMADLRLVFKSDIEVKLYGIAKDPTPNSKKLIAYTEYLEEYNYWKNLRYKQGTSRDGNDVSGRLIYPNLVWKKDKSIWNKLSQGINSNILNKVGKNLCENLGFKNGMASNGMILPQDYTFANTPIISPPMAGNQNDPTKIIIQTKPDIRKANGYKWDGSKCMRKEEIKKINGQPVSKSNCKEMKYTWDNNNKICKLGTKKITKIDGTDATDKNCKTKDYKWTDSTKTCMLNEEIKKINGNNASGTNCKTTKHYKLTCNRNNVALNYFNKNGGPECPNNPTKTSINNCNFSVDKDNNNKITNKCNIMNNEMFVDCEGLDTLYNTTNESTICSGDGKCFFNCKDRYKTMIDGEEVKDRNYIECKKDTFENGYCEGIKCNMPKNNIKDGIFDGECKRNIKGDVPHKTECSLTCNENTYLSSENKLFTCNHGSLENKNNTRCLPKICKDPVNISKAYTPIDKTSNKYQLNRVKGFNIPIQCADNYKGQAVVKACENHNGPWKVSGCTKIECTSKMKTDSDISKMKEDIQSQEKENKQKVQELLFKLGLNDHKLKEEIIKKKNKIKSIVTKHKCMRDESAFNQTEGDNIYEWDSELPENFDVDLVKVECNIDTYKDFKGTALEKMRKKLRQKAIDENKVLTLFKDVIKNESEMDELIKKTIKNSTDEKLKKEYNELTKKISSKKQDMYNHPEGYTIYSENDLHISNLKINVRCAKYYKGSVKVKTCDSDQTPYTMSGCAPDPKHPHNCIDKCKKEDIDNGTCISSMIDKKHGDTVGDCKSILVQGKTCTPTCKPGYFLERKTKCGLKDDKGFIIPAKCKLFVKGDKIPDKPRVKKSVDFTNKDYQDKRTKNMKQYNEKAYQKKYKP